MKKKTHLETFTFYPVVSQNADQTSKEKDENASQTISRTNTLRAKTYCEVFSLRPRKVQAEEDETTKENKSSYEAEVVPSHPRPVLQTVQKTSRKERVNVHTKIKFVKIGDICTLEECFKATIFIQASWREPSLDNALKKDERFELLNTDSYWDPDLSVDNLLEESKRQKWNHVAYTHQGMAYIIQKTTISGTFYESMELRQFPFDSQDLSVVITTSHNADSIRLVVDDNDDGVDTKTFLDSSEWFLHSTSNYSVYNPTAGLSRNTNDDETEEDERLPRSSVVRTAKATRKPQFYVFNIILLMMLLGAVVFGTFAMECNSPGTRLKTTATILLSNITFKMAVNKISPSVSYLTYLDFYMLFCLVQMGLVLGWHAVASQLCQAEDDGKIPSSAILADHIALGVLAFFYVSFNAIYLTTNVTRVYRRIQKTSE